MHGGGGAHLFAVLAHKTLPSRIGQRFRRHPREQRRAGGEFWHPHVVIIAGGKLRTRHPARRTTHGPETKTFVGMARRAKTNDSERHASGRDSAAATRCRSAGRSSESCSPVADRP